MKSAARAVLAEQARLMEPVIYDLCKGTPNGDPDPALTAANGGSDDNGQ